MSPLTRISASIVNQRVGRCGVGVHLAMKPMHLAPLSERSQASRWELFARAYCVGHVSFMAWSVSRKKVPGYDDSVTSAAVGKRFHQPRARVFASGVGRSEKVSERVRNAGMGDRQLLG